MATADSTFNENAALAEAAAFPLSVGVEDDAVRSRDLRICQANVILGRTADCNCRFVGEFPELLAIDPLHHKPAGRRFSLLNGHLVNRSVEHLPPIPPVLKRERDDDFWLRLRPAREMDPLLKSRNPIIKITVVTKSGNRPAVCRAQDSFADINVRGPFWCG